MKPIIFIAMLLAGCASVTSNYQISLPIVAKSSSIYSVEIAPYSAEQMEPYIKDIGASMVRYNGAWWGADQTWVDHQIKALVDTGIPPVIILIGPVPVEAREYSWVECGHIKPEYYDDFAEYAVDVALRHRKVKYFEVWNEPDAPYTSVSDGPFGCWGDPDDEWYGGREYGALLGRVYDALHKARPDIKVVFGGLMLDRPASKRGLFLEGAILGGAKFDVMAFHRYNVYGRETDMAGYDERLAFVRSVLGHYNLYKSVWVNETALLCDDITAVCDQEYEAEKAVFVTELYAWAAENDVERVFWYQLNAHGWRHSGLIGTPAYEVYKSLAR